MNEVGVSTDTLCQLLEDVKVEGRVGYGRKLYAVKVTETAEREYPRPLT